MDCMAFTFCTKLVSAAAKICPSEQDDRGQNGRVASLVLARREKVIEGFGTVANDYDFDGQPRLLEGMQRQLLSVGLSSTNSNTLFMSLPRSLSGKV
jgi:hypothetical protein